MQLKILTLSYPQMCRLPAATVRSTICCSSDSPSSASWSQKKNSSDHAPCFYAKNSTYRYVVLQFVHSALRQTTFNISKSKTSVDVNSTTHGCAVFWKNQHCSSSTWQQDDDTPTITIKVAKYSKKKLSLFLVCLQEGHLAEEDVSMVTNWWCATANPDLRNACRLCDLRTPDLSSNSQSCWRFFLGKAKDPSLLCKHPQASPQ